MSVAHFATDIDSKESEMAGVRKDGELYLGAGCQALAV